MSNMTRIKDATPRPWYFDSKDGFNNTEERETSIGGICADEWVIAAVENDGPSPEADATFIIQAVNWHDALLAELRDSEEKLARVEVAAHSGQYVWRHELDRILEGSE